MSLLGPKPVPAGSSAYKSLRQLVLCRDGCRCQLCGTMVNLEVHRKEFRSHSSQETEEKLLTLCANCHACLHGIP